MYLCYVNGDVIKQNKMEQNKTLNGKLLDAKKEIGKATKNGTNPHFKSKYVDINALIETVEPTLLLHGLVLLQPIENGRVYTRIVDAVSGEQVESFIDMPTTGTPQAIGSAITYYRRYTLQSLLSMQAADDDGQLASKPQPVAPVVVQLPLCNDTVFSKAFDKVEPLDLKEAKAYIDKLRGVYTFKPEQEIELTELFTSKQ